MDKMCIHVVGFHKVCVFVGGCVLVGYVCVCYLLG